MEERKESKVTILIIKLGKMTVYFLSKICGNKTVLKKLESMCLYVSNTYNSLKKLLKLKWTDVAIDC